MKSRKKGFLNLVIILVIGTPFIFFKDVTTKDVFSFGASYKASRAGCFSREVHSVPGEDPNVYGIVFQIEAKLYEAVLYFDPMPSKNVQPNNLILQGVETRPLEPEVLEKYKKVYDSKPCNSGWSPWALS
ncbi:MAG: hypothetical protein ABJL18_07115 [Hyphomicrobiales bacterium]